MDYWQKVHQIPQTNLPDRDAILRVRDKLLIFNIVPQLWADVKYYVPTGFGFSPKASGFYPFGIAKRLFFMFQYPQYLFTEPFNGFNRV